MESIARLLALAERDASRHSEEESTPHRQSANPGKSVRAWIWSFRVGTTALLGVASWFLVPDGAASAASDVVPDSVPSRVEQLAPLPAALSLTAASIERPVRVTDSPRIVRERGTWRIQAAAASRHEAARKLAELSDTHLPAGIDALRSARPLDLQWEGRELAQAWELVIGNEANYALQCSQKRCTAWIVAATTSLEARPIARAREAATAPAATSSRAGRGPEVSEPSAYE